MPLLRKLLWKSPKNITTLQRSSQNPRPTNSLRTAGPLDHINLEPGSKPVFGPIHNLSETELQVLKEYMDEHLRKRFHLTFRRPRPETMVPVWTLFSSDWVSCEDTLQFRGISVPFISKTNRGTIPSTDFRSPDHLT
jgi:hypothetical protein